MTRTYWRILSDMAIAAGLEQDITVWEDQEEVSAGSAPMSISRSNSDSDSEDGMLGPAWSTYKIADDISSRNLQIGQN